MHDAFDPGIHGCMHQVREALHIDGTIDILRSPRSRFRRHVIYALHAFYRALERIRVGQVAIDDIDALQRAQATAILHRAHHCPHLVATFYQHINKMAAQKTGGSRYQYSHDCSLLALFRYCSFHPNICALLGVYPGARALGARLGESVVQRRATILPERASTLSIGHTLSEYINQIHGWQQDRRDLDCSRIKAATAKTAGAAVQAGSARAYMRSSRGETRRAIIKKKYEWINRVTDPL